MNKIISIKVLCMLIEAIKRLFSLRHSNRTNKAEEKKVLVASAIINEELELELIENPAIITMNKTSIIFVNSKGELVDNCDVGYILKYDNNLLKNTLFVNVDEDRLFDMAIYGYKAPKRPPRRALIILDGIMAIAQGVELSYEPNEHVLCIEKREETGSAIFLMEHNGTIAIKMQITIEKMTKTETKILFLDEGRLYMATLEGYESYTNYKILRDVLGRPTIM